MFHLGSCIIAAVLITVTVANNETQSKVGFYIISDSGLEKLSNNGTLHGKWNANGKLKIVVHGFNPLVHLDFKSVIEMQNIYRLAIQFPKFDETLNTVVVDWTHYASQLLFRYSTSASSVGTVGKELAHFLVALKANGGFAQWKDVHILGLSLGSHVAGICGYYVQKLEECKIGRITGFDPAGPEFDILNGVMPKNTTNFLDSLDADFVDIIHTNMGSSTEGKLGSTVQAGHVDFYPNGGSKQLQCNFFSEIQACSHMYSVNYYTLALRDPKSLIGCECDNYENFMSNKCPCGYPGSGQPIGESTSPDARGKYYLVSNTTV